MAASSTGTFHKILERLTVLKLERKPICKSELSLLLLLTVKFCYRIYPRIYLSKVRLNTADIFKGCFYFEGFESNTKSAHKFLLGF